MDLSNDLISQFVKITNDNTKKTASEVTVYGTVVESNGVNYVKIDGSDLLTPVETTTDMVDGERVTVMIKNHSATVTGNISSPAASSATVADIEDQIIEVEGSVSDIVSSDFATKESVEQLGSTLTNNYMTSLEVNNAIASSASDTAYNVSMTYATKEALSDFEDAVSENYVTNANLDNRVTDLIAGIQTDVSGIYATKSSVESIQTNLDANYMTSENIADTYATKSSVESIQTNLDTNYMTSENIADTYATKTSIESIRTNLDTNYMTSENIADTYATKESVDAITHPLWLEDKVISINQNETIDDILDGLPKNMNGCSLTITLESDYLGDMQMDLLINGKVIFDMNGFVLNGLLKCSGKNMQYDILGPGEIRPAHELTDDLSSTVIFMDCDWSMSEVDLYSDGENTNCVGVNSIASRGDLSNINICGEGTFKHFIQATNKSHLYLEGSSGLCSDIILIATNGSIISINDEVTQCGTTGDTPTQVLRGSLIIPDNVIFGEPEPEEPEPEEPPVEE